MTERSSARRLLQSQPAWFWVFAALGVVVLAATMFFAADRVTQPQFEPAAVEGDVENEFIPENRSISECISAVPKPGCGSEARGGWRQGLVLLAILAGLVLIAWRVVVSARKARREQLSASR